MITKLTKELFYKIKPLVGEFSHYLVLASLLEGRTPAKIWVNHPEKPSTTLIWDQLNTLFFLLGDSKNHKFNQKINKLIVDEILPEAIRRQYRKFFLQFGPQHTWDDQIGEILKGIKHEQRFIYSYTLDPTHSMLPLKLSINLPTGFQLARITTELLNNPIFKNLDRVIADIKSCWQSTDYYLKNGGIGFCILGDNVIASWCSTDYVIDNKCELYIETFDGFQRSGLGTQVGIACIQECITRGFTVHWHCFDYAYGSAKIAERIHLQKTDKCPVFITDLQNKDVITYLGKTISSDG